MAYTPDMGRDYWYEFDRATIGTPAFIQIARRSGALQSQSLYMETRAAGTYPEKFLASFQAQKADWITVADVQTNMIALHLGNDWSNVQAALEDFGQGTLLDTRPGRVDNSIHMMDTGDSPPIGYHRWHASIRVTQLLNIGDRAWWDRLDTLVGLAWAIQSFARPIQQDDPNPPIPRSDLQDLRDVWLPMTPAIRDAQFDLPAGQDFGYHPSPKEPVIIAIV